MTPLLDPTNPVVALCAAGMACNGGTGEARSLFQQAWAARRDDYDACVAAHYLARVQLTADEALQWHARAVEHADAVGDHRVDAFRASLYLNLADAHLALGHRTDAQAIAVRAADALDSLPDDGYRAFLAMGIERLRRRLAEQPDPGSERSTSPLTPAIAPR